ncbi:reverse transcriptase domain-containing protein, partial [Tanacetum coccineum]
GQEHSSGERTDEDALPTGIPIEEEILEPWTLFTDGSSCLEGSGAGLILTNPKGMEFTYALRFEFVASNNEVEYEAQVLVEEIIRLEKSYLTTKSSSKTTPSKDWCDKLNIKQKFTSVKHPQTNRLVERANRSVGEGIKARLDQDMLEEKRERAIIRIAKSKARMEKYYNARSAVQPSSQKTLYTEAIKLAMRERGKMGPKWERTFEVVEALIKGAYMFRNEAEIHTKKITRTWNVQVLKKCYL